MVLKRALKRSKLGLAHVRMCVHVRAYRSAFMHPDCKGMPQASSILIGVEAAPQMFSVVRACCWQESFACSWSAQAWLCACAYVVMCVCVCTIISACVHPGSEKECRRLPWWTSHHPFAHNRTKLLAHSICRGGTGWKNTAQLPQREKSFCGMHTSFNNFEILEWARLQCGGMQTQGKYINMSCVLLCRGRWKRTSLAWPRTRS